jgi:hypothetical protein
MFFGAMAKLYKEVWIVFNLKCTTMFQQITYGIGVDSIDE